MTEPDFSGVQNMSIRGGPRGRFGISIPMPRAYVHLVDVELMTLTYGSEIVVLAEKPEDLLTWLSELERAVRSATESATALSRGPYKPEDTKGGD